jgi:hypothetical protein
MGGTKCAAVLLTSAMKKEYLSNHGANCWLKNAAGPLDATVSPGVMFAIMKP